MEHDDRSGVAQLAGRITRLERENRYLKVAFVVFMLLALAACARMGTTDLLKTKRLEIVGKDGTTRAVLGFQARDQVRDHDFTGLVLYDDMSRVRMELGASGDGRAVGLGFRDSTGARVELVSLSSWGPALVLSDADSQPRAYLDLETLQWSTVKPR